MARVSEHFFTKNLNLKFFLEGRGGVGARVSEFSFY